MSSLVFESKTVSGHGKYNPVNATDRQQRKRIFPNRWKHNNHTFNDASNTKNMSTSYNNEFLNFTPDRKKAAGLTKKEVIDVYGKKHFEEKVTSPVNVNVTSYEEEIPTTRRGKKMFYEKSDPILQGGDRYKPQFRPMCKMYKKKRMKELKGDETEKISRKKILKSKVTDHDDVVRYKFASPKNRLENAFGEIGEERQRYEKMLYGMVEDLHYENAHKYNYYKTRKNAKSMIFEDPLYNSKPGKTE